jgi:hypothetical protein
MTTPIAMTRRLALLAGAATGLAPAGDAVRMASAPDQDGATSQ